MSDSPIELACYPVDVLVPDGGVAVVTQEYKPVTHLGVDISVPGHLKDARAQIVAVADGRVLRVARTARGGAVLLDHGGWTSAYLHLDAVQVVVGGVVRAGQVIGMMGADPIDPQGVVHLHFQLAVGGVAVDPAPFLLGLTQE